MRKIVYSNISIVT